MSQELKEGKEDENGSSSSPSNVVVVAVKASKEMPKTALIWALTHLLHPHDTITLLLVLPPQTSSGGRKRLLLWGFPRFSGDCATSTSIGTSSVDLKDSFSKMIMLQLHTNHSNKINVNIKIVSGGGGGVAAEAKKAFANWVIFDKHLKHEKKQCMEELQCNIVVMKHSQPKVLRLNLACSNPTKEQQAKVVLLPDKPHRKEKQIAESTLTPISSPETFTATSSFSSSDPGISPFFIEKKVQASGTKEIQDLENSDSETESDNNFSESSLKSNSRKTSINYSGNVREAISLTRNARSSPPPLCSICKHKGPLFGKPPRWFTYNELELATGGFSRANFLAEGGFGSVHRGVLLDGQAVAVKQHKLASSQGDREFCSEVEVLSCAQHRNVVMLIGFCVEEGRRLLVYEYICNGSLDSHLYQGHRRDTLEWSARQKIAVGAARGLRYLHEDCRVGCIVHRDLRPNNILLTHDFEPMVGDFGLARWQPDGDVGVETRVIGTFGYLAPEYTQSGQITEKADVYSFGVVLVELVTGRKAVDLNRPKGQQCLIEWARPLLDEDDIVNKLIDSRLGSDFDEREVYYMLHAASLCLRCDPHSRPRMSQVLRILEGDHGFLDLGRLLSPGLDGGNRNGRSWTYMPCDNFRAASGKNDIRQ